MSIFTINVTMSGVAEDQHAEVVAMLQTIISQGKQAMATAKQVLALAQQIRTAVDTLEAKITEALARIPNVPPDVQADIDAAFDVLTASVADAADGVDEAATPKP